MKKLITCIVCPRGCLLTAETVGDKITVTGNYCPRGEQHAIGECTNPVRTLTATLRVENRFDTMVSVKSAEPIPKEKMLEAMKQLRTITVNAPIKIGAVLIDDLFGTQILATKEIN